MPVKLLPGLRLFNPSLPALFPSMKLGPSISSPRAIPIFSRIFPFKLKYVGLATSCPLRNGQPGVRTFSVRPFRARTGSGSEYKRSRDRVDDRVSKSLIEDEAELSDWVSELKSDSFRGRLTSEDESGVDRGYKNRNKDRGGESFSTKRRRRDSDSDEFGESNRRRAQAPIGSFSKNSGMNRRFDRGDENFSSQRRSPGSRGENSNLKANSSVGKRSGGNLDMGYNRNRDSRNLREGGKDSRKGLPFVSDEDSEDEQVSKFGVKDLISEEDGDSYEDTDSDEDGRLAKKNATSLSGLDMEIGRKDSPPSSPDKSYS